VPFRHSGKDDMFPTIWIEVRRIDVSTFTSRSGQLCIAHRLLAVQRLASTFHPPAVSRFSEGGMLDASLGLITVSAAAMLLVT